MKEVVKKEVLKLLEAEMIYPISDSEWVSLVHVVPKKGGMTVIRNDKNVLTSKNMTYYIRILHLSKICQM
jgi:predicted P-loop ATPase/GTPase